MASGAGTKGKKPQGKGRFEDIGSVPGGGINIGKKKPSICIRG